MYLYIIYIYLYICLLLYYILLYIYIYILLYLYIVMCPKNGTIFMLRVPKMGLLFFLYWYMFIWTMAFLVESAHGGVFGGDFAASCFYILRIVDFI